MNSHALNLRCGSCGYWEPFLGDQRGICEFMNQDNTLAEVVTRADDDQGLSSNLVTSRWFGCSGWIAEAASEELDAEGEDE